jgi:hypothetical protein
LAEAAAEIGRGRMGVGEWGKPSGFQTSFRVKHVPNAWESETEPTGNKLNHSTKRMNVEETQGKK